MIYFDFSSDSLTSSYSVSNLLLSLSHEYFISGDVIFSYRISIWLFVILFVSGCAGFIAICYFHFYAEVSYLFTVYFFC